MGTGKTRIFAVAAAALLAVTATACGSSGTQSSSPAVVAPPASLVSSGTLTYGTAATFPPFESKSAGGDFEGFDIDMISALADSMGLGTKATDMDFDGLIPALAGKRVDIVNSAMYINDARAAKVDFVPYLVIGESLLTPGGNPKHITRIPEDLSGKTIAVTRGAIGETYMNEYNDQLRQQGLPAMTVMSLPTNQDAMLAVRSGRADAFDTSTPGAATTLAKTGDAFTVAATFKNETKIGIAVRKGDTDTATAIRNALDRFVQSGDYDKLLAKYQIPADSSLFKSTATSTAPAGG
ncbi:ABC transporter substrate-binding protein [Amycolatopsis acidicola]|uniref:ABC transporter substrate-binding protein n=1 Tax=Amycolatopsis acidicola TaxID=2596893 RepID=UPI001FB649C6|nr:ABC transporter substrate-binding protein [Amycolatopsis acidicola]